MNIVVIGIEQKEEALNARSALHTRPHDERDPTSFERLYRTDELRIEWRLP